MADSIYIDTRGLARLASDLRKVSPATWVATRAALKAGGEIVAVDARQRASFSTRVPGSIKTRVLRGDVKISAGGPSAPNAAALENRGRGHPRHPLFGDREHWYVNNTPAFLQPAKEAHQDQVAEMVADAAFEATRIALGAV